MKAACLLSLTIACAALTAGTSYAAPAQQTAASARNHTPGRASLTAAKRPRPLPNGRKGSVSGTAMNLHQPGSGPSGGAATGGLIRNQTVGKVSPVRQPGVARPAVSSLSAVRHRGSNPAVVTGSLNAGARKTGTIDGTRVYRRP
jgi:hypothetical protein